MNHLNKKQLRRSVMFLSAQRPSLIKDLYLYGADSLVLDLEDAVAVTTKDTARFSLYRALKNVDYRDCERVVRINGLDTEYWKEDTRYCIVGGTDVPHIPKTEDAGVAKAVEDAILATECKFEHPEDSTFSMAALESVRDVMSAYEVCTSSEHMIGTALSGGDYTKDPQIKIAGTGVELVGARQQMIIAACTVGVQCFDTVWVGLDNLEGFRREVMLAKDMGFDSKSIINPRQVPIVHEVFTPSVKGIIFSEKTIHEIDPKRKEDVGVFTVDGKMIDIAFYDGTQRVIALAKTSGVYKGEL